MFESMNVLPDKAGTYEVSIDGIMSFMAVYYDFDGENWIIPSEFRGREFWWRKN